MGRFSFTGKTQATELMKGITNDQIFDQCQRLYDRNKKWDEIRQMQANASEPIVVVRDETEDQQVLININSRPLEMRTIAKNQSQATKSIKNTSLQTKKNSFSGGFNRTEEPTSMSDETLNRQSRPV